MEKFKLGDICDFINGRAFKPSEWEKKGLPIVRIQNLNDENAEFNFYSKDIEEKYIIDNNQLLFSWSGTPGTSFGAFFWNRGKAVLNQHIFKIIPKIDINIEFLKYLLNGNLNTIISKSHGGVGLKHITKSELEKIVVHIPEIKKQEYMVKTLNQTLEIINNKKNQLKELDILIKSQFVEMFEGEKYPKDEFINLSKEIYAGGDKPKDISRIKTEEYLFPVFANGYENEGLQGYSKNYRTKDESVTISARGTIGYSSIREGKFTPIVRLITITPNERVNVIYLKYAIDNINIAGSGTSQAQLTVPNVKKQKIIVPPIELQNRFAEIVKQIDKQKFILEKTLKETEELQESLMNKYFG